MSLGTNFNGLAQSRTSIPTGNYAIAVGNRSDFSLTTTTYGEITASSVAGANLYQLGYISQETIQAMIEGDKKAKIGQGDQEINISYAQSLEWVVNQAVSLDEKALQELEDSELVIVVFDLDALTVSTATLASNGNISAGDVKYIFDHCFVQCTAKAQGSEKKEVTIKKVKSNLAKRYSYLAEGVQQTIT